MIITRYKITWCLLTLFLCFSCNSANHDERKAVIIPETFFYDVEDASPGQHFKFTDSVRLYSADAYSGKYVMQLDLNKNFGFGFDDEAAQPGNHYKVSVWRKCEEGDGDQVKIVCADDKGKYIYKAESIASVTRADGWEKLILECTVPPHYQGKKIVIYLWYNGKKKAYYDDLLIEKYKQAFYPEFEEDNIVITLTEDQHEQLLIWRKDAFEKTIIPEGSKEKIKTNFRWKDQNEKIKLRFKGDWLDHLEGEKWSFRIEFVNDAATWRGMKEFSLHTPPARDFLKEWFLHKILEEENIITTRYDFVPVKRNEKSLGLYAYESFFDDLLLQHFNRKNAPIIKLSETGFWEKQLVGQRNGQLADCLAYYESAEIRPFNKKQVFSDSVLRYQFIKAQDLLYAYQQDKKLPKEVFDLEKMAQYIALCDLTDAYHGLTWHNIRFYFDPDSERLEPIAYDCYAVERRQRKYKNDIYGFHEKMEEKVLGKDDYFILKLFHDEAFLEKYLFWLKKYTETDFIQHQLAKWKSERQKRERLIQQEFAYSFDEDFYLQKEKIVEEYIPRYEACLKNPAFRFVLTNTLNDYQGTAVSPVKGIGLKAYLEKSEEDIRELQLVNFHVCNIQVVAYGNDDGKNTIPLDEQVFLAAFKNGQETREKLIMPTGYRFLFYHVEEVDTLYRQEIFPWSYPEVLN